MAFEDRFSPASASSPSANSDNLHINSPNSPESSRTSPYTCTTIQQEGGRMCVSSPNIKMTPKEQAFFSITSFITSPKESQPKEPKDLFSQFLLRTTTNPYANYPRSPSTDSMVSYNHSEASSSPPPKNEEEPTIQTLKYSIRNILQPDFGKSAVLKTKSSPIKIGFKPYESPEKKIAPLGSLCQTVSQIGKIQEVPRIKTPDTKPLAASEETKTEEGKVPQVWPAWVYCTRYSDRPSSGAPRKRMGPRSRRVKKADKAPSDDKRPRTAFSGAQLARLKHEFAENRYLTERRRQQLSQELGLNEAQIKIWFQNKRAKIKKSSGQKNPLALQLMAQGLYNHSTVACDEEDMPLPN